MICEIRGKKPIKTKSMSGIRAYIAKDDAGVHRVFCQRARRKWWFELGRHRATDAEFARALESGEVEWERKIKRSGGLFKET